MAVRAEALPLFDAMCARERCPYAVVGVATDGRASRSSVRSIRGAPRRRCRRRGRSTCRWTCCSASRRRCIATCARRPSRSPRARPRPASRCATVAFDVLRHPTVASKRFLITIGDRTVGGLSSRDPMVGPWQVPVADCAVTLADYAAFAGEAMAMGERTPLAALDAPASGRMAVGEAITNLLARADRARRASSSAATGWPPAATTRRARRRRRALRHGAARSAWSSARRSASACRSARTALSMRTRWRDDGGAPKQVTAPVSLIVTAFATLADVRAHADAAAAAGRHDAGPGRPRPGPACAWPARCWRRCWTSSATQRARPRRSARS